MELRRKRRELRALNPAHRRSLNPYTQLFLDLRKRERERNRVPAPIARLKSDR